MEPRNFGSILRCKSSFGPSEQREKRKVTFNGRIAKLSSLPFHLISGGILRHGMESETLDQDDDDDGDCGGGLRCWNSTGEILLSNSAAGDGEPVCGRDTKDNLLFVSWESRNGGKINHVAFESIWGKA